METIKKLSEAAIPPTAQGCGFPCREDHEDELNTIVFLTQP
jgi:hypothetical protein